MMLAEIIDEAGVPPGVFNLVNGTGVPVGEAIAAHPEIDMVSFTGSTRAGIRVAQLAAETVKRVAQELGGKSANIILDDVDMAKAVTQGVTACYTNAGQNCQSPTRMLVPVAQRDAVMAAARAAVEAIKLGNPLDPETELGPLVSRQAFDKVQSLIQSGIDEGATLVVGGPGRPSQFNRGYFVRPTVFADVEPHMRIAREEIFGPVLSIMTYRERRRGGGDRQRHPVRACRVRPVGRSGPRSAHCEPHAGGPRLLQRRAVRPGAAVRRLQAVRQRPRVRAIRLRGLPRGQGAAGFR